MQCLQYELERLKLQDAALPPLAAFAVLDCVHAAIVGSSENLAQFLAAGGLMALLDMLDSGSVLLQPLLLTTLAGEHTIQVHGVLTHS